MEPKKEHKCLRCGYTWRSAKEDKDIKACCYCKSYKWRIKKEEGEK